MIKITFVKKIIIMLMIVVCLQFNNCNYFYNDDSTNKRIEYRTCFVKFENSTAIFNIIVDTIITVSPEGHNGHCYTKTGNPWTEKIDLENCIKSIVDSIDYMCNAEIYSTTITSYDSSYSGFIYNSDSYILNQSNDTILIGRGLSTNLDDIFELKCH